MRSRGVRLRATAEANCVALSAATQRRDQDLGGISVVCFPALSLVRLYAPLSDAVISANGRKEKAVDYRQPLLK
jgi:hypothetical protein